MDELIIRSLQGEATPPEEQQLQAWRRASLENEKHYRGIARLWALTGRAAPAETVGPVPSAAELIGGAVATGGIRTAFLARRGVWLARTAAAAALVVLGFALAELPSGEREDAAFGAAEFVTGPAELVTARLSDGSVVRLAPQSRLRVTKVDGGREVWLDGQAFFAVAKQEGRPFVVRTRAGNALVLGTRFDVRVDQNDLRVVVVEGRVALSAGGEQVEVAAGEMSRALRGAPPSVEAVADVGPMLDWMGPFLVFESTPLRQVAREIERRYRIRVELPDSALAERTVTAWFTDQSVEEVLMVICRVVDAHCSVRDTVVSIEP